MSANEIHEIELNIKEAKKFVDLGKSLERLQSNRDFKKVVEEGFFKDEAVRLVHLKSSPAMQRPEQQAAIDAEIRAVGAFAQYLNLVFMKADHAAKAIEDNEAELDELRAEGADE